jgi:hypothetical protein
MKQRAVLAPGEARKLVTAGQAECAILLIYRALRRKQRMFVHAATVAHQLRKSSKMASQLHFLQQFTASRSLREHPVRFEHPWTGPKIAMSASYEVAVSRRRFAVNN